MSITSNEEAAADQYRIETQIAGGHSRQIRAAFERLADAQIPLKGTSYDNDPVTGGGGHSDHVGELAVLSVLNGGDRAQRIRSELLGLLRQFTDVNKRISVIVGEWAPTNAPTAERPAANLTIWCANHLASGHMEPRGGDGGQNCTWCRDIKSRYGKLPNKALIDLKGKRGKIDDATYRRYLGKKVA